MSAAPDDKPPYSAEQALRESEIRYDLAARAGRVGIWDWDLRTGTIYISKNLKALLGFPPDEPLEHGPNWQALLHPDDHARVDQATDDHLAGRTPVYELEVRRRHRDGNYRLFLSRGTASRDPLTGQALRLTGTLTDITDFKRAEEALRASETRYALATNTGRVGVWEWHIPSDTLHLSDSLKALLGYAPHELPGMDRLTWRTHLHPDDLPVVLEATESHLAGRTPGYEIEFRRRHKDGSYRWMLSRAAATPDPAADKPIRMIGVVTDITDRKRAEEARRASEEQFRTLLEQSPVATYIFSPQGIFLRCNQAAIDMYGVDPSELVGYCVFDHPMHQTNGIADAYRRAGQGIPSILPETGFVPYRGSRKGKLTWIRGSIYPLRDSAGRVQAVVATNEDITERKHADDTLRASVDLSRRLLLELDHRVRNNLAGLISLVALTRDRATSIDAFASAIDARLRAMSQVHHLLGESRWQDVDLRTLLSKFLSNSHSLTSHGTPVHLDGPPILLPAAQALPLTMILTEFLTNSVKYGAHSSPAGQVALSWSVQSKDEGRRMKDEKGSDSSSSSFILHPSSFFLSLQWTESHGPPVPPNPTQSLGSALIQSFATRELAGSCTLTYPPTGAAHTLTFPLPA